MLTHKDMVKSQKMLDYIEAYLELIDIRTEFFTKFIEETNPKLKKEYRKMADETGAALKIVAGRALNDKQIRG